jgi:hypothetical protein
MPLSSFPGQQSPRITRQQLLPTALDCSRDISEHQHGRFSITSRQRAYQNEISESRHTSLSMQTVRLLRVGGPVCSVSSGAVLRIEVQSAAARRRGYNMTELMVIGTSHTLADTKIYATIILPRSAIAAYSPPTGVSHCGGVFCNVSDPPYGRFPITSRQRASQNELNESRHTSATRQK